MIRGALLVTRARVAAAAVTLARAQATAAPTALPLALLLTLPLMLTGCAASGERAAREDWRQALVSYERPADPTDPARSEANPGQIDEPQSLEDALRIAESGNPGLAAAFDRWTAALERVPQARSLPDPKMSYAYFLEPVETRVGPQRQKFGLAQTFPLFGKLGLRGEAAVHAANAEGARFEQARLDLRLRVTRLWNDYFFLGRSIGITEENFALLTHLEDVALRQYSAGKASQADLLRAQLERGKVEDRLRSLKDQRAPFLSSLNAEMGRRPDSPIPWPEALSSPDLELSVQGLEEALEARSPQLAALQAMAEKERAGSELAGKSSLPDLTLSAEYTAVDEARMPNVSDSGKDVLVAMGTISLPLWFGRNRAERSEAAARLSAAESEYASRRNQLVADLGKLHFEFRDAGRRIELYEFTLLPRARQSLEVTENAFTVGKASFLDLIDAQRSLLELGLAKERAVADRATRRAEIAALTAIDVRGPAVVGHQQLDIENPEENGR